jgi:Co/Zn/Cd efflux system component
MNSEEKLRLAVGIALVFLVAELLGGYLARSLAIFSDAAHLLADILGFGVSLAAAAASRRPKCETFTYGYARAEVLGAFLSLISLWLVTAWLLLAACSRMIDWFEGRAEVVDGRLMFLIALLGVVVNLALVFVLGDSHTHAGSHCALEQRHGPPADKLPLTLSEPSSNDSSADHRGHRTVLYQRLDDFTDDMDGPSYGGRASLLNTAHEHEHDHDHENQRRKLPDAAPINYHDHPGTDMTTLHNHKEAGKHPPTLTTTTTQSHTLSFFSSSLSPISEQQERIVSSHGYGSTTKVAEDVSLATSSHHHNHHTHHHAHHHQHHSRELGHDHAHAADLNLQAAWVHAAADLAQSVGVAVAGLIIWLYPTWQIADPLATFLFTVLVVRGTLPLGWSTLLLLMEARPDHVCLVSSHSSLLPLM